MQHIDIIKDKTLKVKEKVDRLAEMLLKKETTVQELIHAAAEMRQADIAIIMECLEHVTKDKKNFATQEVFDFAVKHIEASSPALKRESARVTGNTISISMRNIDKAVARLLVNTEDPGTVVRWSAAFALGEIFKQHIPELPRLRDTLEAIIRREEKESIRKIYIKALRNTNT